MHLFFVLKACRFRRELKITQEKVTLFTMMSTFT